MTTFRPNHHDPAPDRGADAVAAGSADALDALLDGIAQGMGSPASRTGRGSTSPDARTDRIATIDDGLLRDACAFHRRFAAAEARSPGAATPSPQLWEQIMASTVSSPLATGTTRITGSTQPPSRTGARPTRHHRPRLLSHSWQAFGNATLALLVILAAFGVWRVYDGMNGAGTPPPESTVPGLAMLPGTPDPGADTVTAPAATPTPAYACDFSQDIPIFTMVDEPPVGGTVLLLTTTGDLVLTCPEEPEPITLANGLDQVGPGGWPGIVSGYSGLPDDGDYRAFTVNVMTGRSMQFGFSQDTSVFGDNEHIESPWLVAPSAINPAQWEVTDLRTMESRPVAELTGAPLPENANILIAESMSGTLAIAAFTPYAGDPAQDWGGAIIPDLSAQGDILILDGSLGATNWISLPDDLMPAQQMRFSPDGTHLALITGDNDLALATEIVYALLDTTGGREVGRSAAVQVDDPILAMTWVQDGEALAYLDGQTLMVLPVGGEPRVVLDAPDQLRSLRNTVDPNVVTVDSWQPEEVATETPDLVTPPRMYAVNTVTGESIEFEGRDVREEFGWEQPPARYLVLSETWVDDAEPTTYRVVDVVTGEEVGTIENAEMGGMFGQAGFGTKNSVSFSIDGATGVIGFGAANLWLVQATADGPVIRQLPPPAPDGVTDVSNAAVSVFVSPDGLWLSLAIEGDESRTRWLLPLDGAADEWIEVPSTVPGSGSGSIQFVPGTGD